MKTTKRRPKGRNINRPEQDLQIQIADFLRLATIPPARWWHVPNGVGMSKTQRAMRQKMGLTPGVPDLHFAWERLGYPYFGVIELKASPAGNPSEAQDIFLANMHQIGHFTSVEHSFEGIIARLTAWGFPLKDVKL